MCGGGSHLFFLPFAITTRNGERGKNPVISCHLMPLLLTPPPFPKFWSGRRKKWNKWIGNEGHFVCALIPPLLHYQKCGAACFVMKGMIFMTPPRFSRKRRMNFEWARSKKSSKYFDSSRMPDGNGKKKRMAKYSPLLLLLRKERHNVCSCPKNQKNSPSHSFDPLVSEQAFFQK